MIHVLLSIAIWSLPPKSILATWRLAMAVARQWPKLLPSGVPEWAIHGGPLGYGCSKIVEVLTGIILWRLAYPEEVLPLSVGQHWPSLVTCSVTILLALITNVVLSLWSKHHNHSRGDHEGVNAIVKSSFGRTLTPKEHIQLASVAVLNAMAEEASSRGFWLNEFMLRGKLSFWHANLCQAISFGVWHCHGIPSGVTGVVLTAVYGFAMGLLHQYGNGLLLPVVAHSIADYFIFAVIARQGGFGSTR
jgi:membrane protease YdiL (CAAX protease family)